jgi:Domain of unknown function (DUF892)
MGVAAGSESTHSRARDVFPAEGVDQPLARLSFAQGFEKNSSLGSTGPDFAIGIFRVYRRDLAAAYPRFIQPSKVRGNVMKELGKLFEHTLMDIYYAENQILKALPKLAQKAKCPS